MCIQKHYSWCNIALPTIVNGRNLDWWCYDISYNGTSYNYKCYNDTSYNYERAYRVIFCAIQTYLLSKLAGTYLPLILVIMTLVKITNVITMKGQVRLAIYLNAHIHDTSYNPLPTSCIVHSYTQCLFNYCRDTNFFTRFQLFRARSGLRTGSGFEGWHRLLPGTFSTSFLCGQRC